MTRSIVSITQSQIQAIDTIKGLMGRRARIHARKVHVEDIDITLHIVVADDIAAQRRADAMAKHAARCGVR
jgi:hypothetical protein